MKTVRTKHPLLDTLIVEARLRNDAELADHLKIGRSVISSLRKGTIRLSDTNRIKIMRKFRMSLVRLDSLYAPDEVTE